MVEIEDMHLGEPRTVGLMLEDADGIPRQFCRFTGVLDDDERPPGDLIRILAVLLKVHDFERMVLPVSWFEAAFPELPNRFPSANRLRRIARGVCV